MAETVRELAVRLQMAVDRGSFGQAEKAIAGVKAQSESLGSQFGGLLGKAAAFVGIAALAGKAKEAFVEFNSSIEQSTISLATTHKMFRGGTWAESMKTASGLFEHYQDVAKRSVGETKDFLEMHQSIAASAYQAGAQLEDLKKITEGAVVAGQALGESSYVTAMDIKQALTKGVEVRDRFMNIMLASQKLTKEQFNAMTKLQRVETLKKLLTADTIKEAAKQMEGSFAGVTSTFRDNLKIALGKAGENFFKGATERLKNINTWIEKNQDSVKKMMGLVDSGLTALSTMGKGLTAILGIAVAPLIKALELLQDVQDYGNYREGKFSIRGMKEAYAKGPEEYDRYIREKYYGEKVARPGKARKMYNADGTELVDMGRPTDALDEAGEGFGKWAADAQMAYRQGRLWDFIRSGSPSEAQGAWTRNVRALRNARGQSIEQIRQDRAAGHTYYPTGGGRYGRGDAVPESRDVLGRAYGETWRLSGQSVPDMNYAGPYGPQFVPSIPAPGVSTAPETKVSGDVNIKVKVDVPNIEASVEKVIESKWREGGELMSSEP